MLLFVKAMKTQAEIAMIFAFFYLHVDSTFPALLYDVLHDGPHKKKKERKKKIACSGSVQHALSFSAGAFNSEILASLRQTLHNRN